MFNELLPINLFSLTISDILLNITVALMCGIFIAWLYQQTYRGPGYSISYVNSIVLLAMITAVVIMVIGNNLARAFGLVGAMSIIRFRTAVKETQDIVYIFFGLTIGLASGAGFYKIAIIGTLFIGLVLYIFSKSTLATPKKEEYLLQFSIAAGEETTLSYLPVLNKYCNHYKVINAKSIGDKDLFELSYYIKLKDNKKNNEFIRELQNVFGIKQINLFFDEEQF